MRKSTRITVTYAVIALVMAGCVVFLEWAVYQSRSWPGSLEDALRPFALIGLPFVGLFMIYATLFDPVARRIVRQLRFKELKEQCNGIC